MLIKFEESFGLILRNTLYKNFKKILNYEEILTTFKETLIFAIFIMNVQ